MLNLFSCAFYPFIISFNQVPHQIFCPFFLFSLGFLFWFYYWVEGVQIYQNMFYKHFFLHLWLAFLRRKCFQIVFGFVFNFAIYRMLYKWNHRVSKVLRLRSIQVVVCIDSLFLFLLHGIPLCERIIVCLAIHLLKDILVVYNLGLL